MTGNRNKPVFPAVLWFTGLSGAGKSTLAGSLDRRLRELALDTEMLDGDVMRGIFPGTGFSREARNEHIRRVGYIASLLEKHGVTVLASFISPYRESREFVRGLCRRFIEIHVATPVEECEKRDVKGLYMKARSGEITGFTGLDDPYEPPVSPEIRIDTTGVSLDWAVNILLENLKVYGMKTL